LSNNYTDGKKSFTFCLSSGNAMTLTRHLLHTHIGVALLERHVTGGPQAVEFGAIVRDFLAQGGRHLVVDITGVEAMNSSGLGMLVGAVTTLRKAGGKIVLACVSPGVQNLLTITRLHTVFETYPTVEEAVIAVQG
jgi:anti-sigma B factor antagonist